MRDDPVVREALTRVQDVIQQLSDSGSPSVIEALSAVAAAVENLARANHNLVTQQALLDDRLIRIEHHSAFSIVQRRLAAATALLRSARGGADDSRESTGYEQWVSHEAAAFPSLADARAAAAQWPEPPTFSLILTSPTQQAIRSALDTLAAQAWPYWELCAAVEPGSENFLAGLPQACRCTVFTATDRPAAWNAAATLATGDYLCLLPETGTLSPLALFAAADALRAKPCDVLYCDDDVMDAAGVRSNPVFRPDWSPDLLTSGMYPGSLVFLNRGAFEAAGGFCARYRDAALFDLLLRLADDPAIRVHHIPHVLFHRRPDAPAIPALSLATQVITDTLARRENVQPVVSAGPAPGTFLIRRNRKLAGMTAVICSRTPALLETCLTTLRDTASAVIPQIVVIAHEEEGTNSALRDVIRRSGATAIPFTAPFDFSAMSNTGAAAATSPHLLFLNDDLRFTVPGWAELLAEQISRDEIGVAGSVMWYPSGALQHAGIGAGINDGVGHTGRYARSSAIWPWLVATRNVSAVTGACLAIRKRVFEEIGGFDPLFPRNYNDVDLCFRVRASGYRILCVPAPGIIHSECQTRRGIVRFDERYRFYQRWAELLSQPDPYYSPALTPTETVALNLSGDNWYRPLLSPQTLKP